MFKSENVYSSCDSMNWYRALIIVGMGLFFAGCLFQTTQEMDSNQARLIANASVCARYGNVTHFVNHNDATDTWWVAMETTKPGCYPGCVVYANGSVNMSWACTGFVMPKVIAKPAQENASTIDYALSLCSMPNVSEVTICNNESIRVNSPLLGNGSIFYKDRELVAVCRTVPVTAPEAPCNYHSGAEAPCMGEYYVAEGLMSDQCYKLSNGCRLNRNICPASSGE